MRYHGNYCGSYWSAGKHQPSVIDDSVPAVDKFDHSCKDHDGVYASDGDLIEADYKFFRQNFLKGTKETPAALAVGAQYLARRIFGINNKVVDEHASTNQKMKKTSNLRGAQARGAALHTVPASYGFSLKLAPTTISRKGQSAVASGSDFAGSVSVVNSSNYVPAATVPINPAYFQNAMLGSLSRTYERFRFVKAVLEYIPQAPTSSQGQVIMLVSQSIKTPFLDGGSSSFLSRALSQGNAVATPIWREEMIDIPCNAEWSLTNPLMDGDLDDSIAAEIQVYATSAATFTAGILLLHYTIEFKNPIYTLHPLLIPIPYGLTVPLNFVDDSAISPANDAVRLTSTISGTAGIADGAVFRVVMRLDASTAPAGCSFASGFKVSQSQAASTTLTLVSTQAISISNGTVFYLNLQNNVFGVYCSYDDAVIGSAKGALVYTNATTAVGTWSFGTTLVRMGNTTITQSQ